MHMQAMPGHKTPLAKVNGELVQASVRPDSCSDGASNNAAVQALASPVAIVQCWDCFLGMAVL